MYSSVLRWSLRRLEGLFSHIGVQSGLSLFIIPKRSKFHELVDSYNTNLRFMIIPELALLSITRLASSPFQPFPTFKSQRH